MIRKNITGANKMTVDTAKSWVATHDRGRAEKLIREMVRDTDALHEAYGGSRDNVRLTSIPDGVVFLKAHGCDVPFGYE